jgi:peptide/nickel transport system permease protein
VSENPRTIVLANGLQAPSALHWLGCDSNGTDILAILANGAKISLGIGVSATAICVSIGLLLGSIAGFFGGKIDAILMRFLEIIFAFPGIILAIALASLLRPGYGNLILCLVATGWAGYARLVRGEIKNLIQLEYVEAARALGVNSWRIIVRHLWPNIASTLLVSATFGLAGMILAEASLSFLGVGVPPGTPSWGSLLSAGKQVLVEAPHVAFFPGMAVMLAVLSFNLLGEGIREWLDPKSAQ